MPTGASSSCVDCPNCGVRHQPLHNNVTNGVYAGTCLSCGHFFKFRAQETPKSSVSFSINGKQYTVTSEQSASLSLNEFLRDQLHLTGTKVMCKEGGCGCCMVTAVHYDHTMKQDVFIAINSCLCPVFACDGWKFITTEGIGSSRKGFHPIQEKIAEFNGSQCGFCTPGMVMSMNSYLEQHPKLTKAEVESIFDGNICRCTGYRSILDAMKTFAVDSESKSCCKDIEDLGRSTACRSGQRCQQGQSSASALHLVTSTSQWFKVTSLAVLYQTLSQVKQQNYTLVFGHTGNGVYYVGSYDVYIDIRDVPELHTCSLQEPVSIGASVTLTNLMTMLTTLSSTQGYEYLSSFVQLIRKVAHMPVRNVACWAGNLMLRYNHPEFPSDVFTFLEAVGTQLTVGSYDGQSSVYSLTDWLKTDMKGKVILNMKLPRLQKNDFVNVYKVMPRAQNAHSYVTGAFRFNVDKASGYTVGSKPSMVYAGISPQFVHAVKTEQFLTGKKLSDADVLKNALTILQSELVTSHDPVLPSGEYRSKVAMGLFYKFVLGVCSAVVADEYKSGATTMYRPISSGQQTFGTKKKEWPVTESIPKLSAKLQASGEAKYVADMSNVQGLLYASFVTSTESSAKISSIDASGALKMPGVVAFLSAKDIPGVNNFTPVYPDQEEVFCSEQVLYYGQAIGLIVADTQEHADSACYAVQVTYTNQEPPILTMQDAIGKQSFFPKPTDDIIVGNAEAAIQSSDKVVTGEIAYGPQYHFHMETQNAVSVPTEEGGVDVYASTQWTDACQQAVATVLGIKNSKVRVQVKRIGGAYGAKISRNFQMSAASALAAHVTNKPVKIHMSIWSNIAMVGKRFPYMAKYTAGVSKSGKLNGIRITYYSDCGSSPNDNSVQAAMLFADNAYFCENWHLDAVAVRTNTPSNTAMRAPGYVDGIVITETIMDHIAKELGLYPMTVRFVNLYQKGQVTFVGQPLTYCNISEICGNLAASAEFEKRQADIQTFNKVNRWKKRGIAMMPLKWGAQWTGGYFNVYLTIYNGDGTIGISHGGVECGQGINTKVAQVCAYELGVPMEMITILPTDSVLNANSSTTGGSITSELCSLGVIHCCQQLRDKMAPVKARMKTPVDWKQLVQECYTAGVDLTARYYVCPKTPNFFEYNIYGAACSEVELDVLTGESQITRTDILYDCGDSTNPGIDVSQAEGAFVMGLGYCLTERTVYDPKTGANLTTSTWEYKPPSSHDIPIDFRITFLQNNPNPLGVLGSKGIGEPPLTLSYSVLLALKNAIYSVRSDHGDSSYCRLDVPATVERVLLACDTDPSQFVLK